MHFAAAFATAAQRQSARTRGCYLESEDLPDLSSVVRRHGNRLLRENQMLQPGNSLLQGNVWEVRARVVDIKRTLDYCWRVRFFC